MRSPINAAILAALTLCCATGHATEIQIYFSPHGGCQAAIIAAIADAEHEILMAAYSFTSKPIADALLDAARRGVAVHLLVDKRQPTAHHTQVTRFPPLGIPTAKDTKHHLMHQKLLVIDRQRIIAGSYNFSANAETRNAEILLIIDDPTTAKAAADNWHKLNNAATPLTQTPTDTKPNTRLRHCHNCTRRPRFKRRP